MKSIITPLMSAAVILGHDQTQVIGLGVAPPFKDTTQI